MRSRAIAGWIWTCARVCGWDQLTAEAVLSAVSTGGTVGPVAGVQGGELRKGL